MRGIFQLVLSALFCFASATVAHAGDDRHFEGWVPIDGKRSLYVDFIKPEKGAPVVVLVNGLTYRVGSWDPFVHYLQQSGVGILRFDPMGQGETLLRYAPALQPFDYMDQVLDMKKLFQKLKLNKPLHLVGLSYGGALATIFATMWPDHVASIISMAPFVAPLESQDQWIRTQIRLTRISFPGNPATDDQLYDFFLRQIVYSTYPSAEPVVLENPYKLESTFRLVQGIRKYLAADIADQLPKGRYHLLIARRDQYVENRVHNEHWNRIPPRARGSRVFIEESEHKIPEAIPEFAAKLVLMIVKGDPLFSRGRTLLAIPSEGVIRNSERTLVDDMPKDRAKNLRKSR